MQTLSSASRTCMASASAVECTATVAIPSSLHARRMRRAISPRLAMRILSNIVVVCSVILRSALFLARLEGWLHAALPGHPSRLAEGGSHLRMTSCFLFNNHQRLAEFDRLAILDEDLRHGAGARRWNMVHRLHRLDDQER